MTAPVAAPLAALREWRTLAEGLASFRPSCTFTSSDEWFEVATSKTLSQKQRAEIAEVCLRCPLAVPCRRYAQAADERFGCWGGWWADEGKRAADRRSAARRAAA